MSENGDGPKPGEIVPPEYHRLLTREELARATDWINQKAVKPNDGCQICDSPHSEVQPGFAPLPGGVSPFGDGMGWLHPCIVTICQNCGFMRYFNAVVMGFLPGYQPKGEENGGAG